MMLLRVSRRPRGDCLGIFNVMISPTEDVSDEMPFRVTFHFIIIIPSFIGLFE